jgi:hypothetical protein
MMAWHPTLDNMESKRPQDRPRPVTDTQRREDAMRAAGAISAFWDRCWCGRPYQHIGALFSGWPAIAFVGSVETVLQLGKIKRNQPRKDAERAKLFELENLDGPIEATPWQIMTGRPEKNPGDLPIGGMGFTRQEILREMPVDKRGGSVAPPNAPTPPISTKLPDPPQAPKTRKPRVKDGLPSVAQLQKLAHCGQPKAYRLRAIMQGTHCDLDKALLVDKENQEALA